MTPHKREAEPIHEDPSSKRSKSQETSDLRARDSSVSGVTSKSEDVASGDASKLTPIEADAAEDKGCRHSMEDAWVLLPDASLEFSGNLRYIFANVTTDIFGYYIDVHILQYMMDMGAASQQISHKRTYMQMYLRQDYHMDIKVAKKAILEGFRRTDESLLKDSEKGNWKDGATAVCVWVLGQTVIIANIGDAKAVLARASTTNVGETTLKSIVLTREHKAIFPQERNRIQKAGGTVGSNGRLQGRLEVSRAFGDRQFKKVGVICSPDIHSFELTERDQFVILGCDGLWGVLGPSDAVEFVQQQLKETSSTTTAVRRLVREAVRERRCRDNCTAIVIVFKH